MDLLIALLQSLVVLLLASGVYVALVVRKPGGPAAKRGPDAPAVPRVPRSVT
jgi:flagellar basal body-associated protein FliL